MSCEVAGFAKTATATPTHHCSSPHYTERLNRLPSNELISLNSVYSQVDHAKKVASAFAELLANGEESVVSEGISMYLEILFIENSLPLHRTMLSALAKGRKSHPEIADCFRNYFQSKFSRSIRTILAAIIIDFLTAHVEPSTDFPSIFLCR
ncbi:hypothetical protein Sjap_023887 [Stephania japonica]|uniref:Uncharacterized protein n=1 Tax=Stephania japonica TaxID=461633 RepID=A0AAP0EEJ6_9MAGN